MLIVALVCVVVALAITVSIIKLAATGRRMCRERSWQVQAAWLAESGLERAAWRLADQPDYTGETWSLSADELATTDAAVVTIQVETIPDRPDRRRVRVRADYPNHPQHRARASKQAVVQVEI